jgi:hypothetical protein
MEFGQVKKCYKQQNCQTERKVNTRSLSKMMGDSLYFTRRLADVRGGRASFLLELA